MIAKFEVVVVGPEKLLKDFNRDLVELLFSYNFATHSVKVTGSPHDEILLDLLSETSPTEKDVVNRDMYG